jgi:NDP-sugar pyrophosphorylase family protein
MKAVILAAGKGERLGPVTEKIPKPMIAVAGRPILEHNIVMCRKSGIKDILINLHHLPEIIKTYFGDGGDWGVNISYSFEPQLLGTAGTVSKFNDDLLGMPFYVIYGDNYFGPDFNLLDLRRFHEKNISEFTIVLSHLEDISQSGVAEVTDNGRITGFVEKPINVESHHSWINAGMYLVEPIILEEIASGYGDFGNDVIPLLIENNRNVYGYKMNNDVLPIDTPKLLARHAID